MPHYRSIVNYDYWEMRCAAEQEEQTVDARELLYDARKAHETAELKRAKSQYDQAWQKWDAVFGKFPRLRDDITAEELKESLQRYLRLLQQLDEELPENFVLQDMLKKLDITARGTGKTQPPPKVAPPPGTVPPKS